MAKHPVKLASKKSKKNPKGSPFRFFRIFEFDFSEFTLLGEWFTVLRRQLTIKLQVAFLKR